MDKTDNSIHQRFLNRFKGRIYLISRSGYLKHLPAPLLAARKSPFHILSHTPKETPRNSLLKLSRDRKRDKFILELDESNKEQMCTEYINTERIDAMAKRNVKSKLQKRAKFCVRDDLIAERKQSKAIHSRNLKELPLDFIRKVNANKSTLPSSREDEENVKQYKKKLILPMINVYQKKTLNKTVIKGAQRSIKIEDKLKLKPVISVTRDNSKN
eukprot:TRINITY_DN8133_c0_g3_i1.p1 TRINITY_DN8133_c0_g3~~TRINITY_DN8133_c0_g3_i1.p1  ORF type:complete len:214 (-),score=28.14 TRINITY_DN8133_c0_g3_i1:47-688(-)